MPPLWGLGLWLMQFLHRCRPSGTKEVACGIQYFCAKSGAVGKPHLPGLGIQRVNYFLN